MAERVALVGGRVGDADGEIGEARGGDVERVVGALGDQRERARGEAGGELQQREPGARGDGEQRRPPFGFASSMVFQARGRPYKGRTEKPTASMPMRYLHTMIRVTDLDASTAFFAATWALRESPARRRKGRFTLVFLAASDDEAAGRADKAPLVELTYNWDPEVYGGGRNFGHLAYEVDDIYAYCAQLRDAGIVINRPPRDGRMAFIRSPDNISIELCRKARPCPAPSPGPRCRTPESGEKPAVDEPASHSVGSRLRPALGDKPGPDRTPQ